MKYIARFSDPDEIHRIRHLLRSKGIPTYEKTVVGRKMGWQAVLYVCMAEHVDDSLRLIRNPSHKVANPVNAEEFEKALENPDTTQLTKLITLWGFIICASCLGLFYLLWKYTG